MGMGGSASARRNDGALPDKYQPHDILTVVSWREQAEVAGCILGWFVFSLASLFFAKHVLHVYKINEAVFTLWQFSASVLFGLVFTNVMGCHSLAKLSSSQLRAVVPLSIAFLVKEVLKYSALARVSVNLVNTIRSLGPLFNVSLEFLLYRHRPPVHILWSLVPIIIGVALTSVDELHSASVSGVEILTCSLGLFAAVLSTAINNGQNIYSKTLFGRERIDPVSLQIYLSAISLVIMTPGSMLQLLYHTFTSPNPPHHFFAPSLHVAAVMALAGFVNFVSSQLAFNTLNRISPLSYSVANTFKRVCIAVIAIAYFNEHLSPVNGAGIAVSIAGVFIYERFSRAYKESPMYKKLEVGNPIPIAHRHTGSEDRLDALDLSSSDDPNSKRNLQRQFRQQISSAHSPSTSHRVPKPPLPKYPQHVALAQSVQPAQGSHFRRDTQNSAVYPTAAEQHINISQMSNAHSPSAPHILSS